MGGLTWCDLIGVVLAGVTMPVWYPFVYAAQPPRRAIKKLKREWDYRRPLPTDVHAPALPRPRGRRRALSITDPGVQHPDDEGGNTTCLFWKLPYELREMIWLHLLNYNSTAEIGQRKDGRLVSRSGGLAGVQLLRTNRRFYNELTPLLHALPLTIHQPNTLTTFTHLSSPRHLSSLRHLTFTAHYRALSTTHKTQKPLVFHVGEWTRALHHLRFFTALETLTVRIEMDDGLEVPRRFSGKWTWGSRGSERRKVYEELMGRMIGAGERARGRIAEGCRIVVFVPWTVAGEGERERWARAGVEVRGAGDGGIEM